MYPGIWWRHLFNYDRCASHCRRHYGGLAAIHNHQDQRRVHDACYDILHFPKPKDWHSYGYQKSKSWRGHSCFIGLRRGTGKGHRKFDMWDDKSKVRYKYWAPGEPNDGGHRRVCTRRNWWGRCRRHSWVKNADEDCTELYAYNSGKWNDIGCHAQRSCVCQDPKGQIHGQYVGVGAERSTMRQLYIVK